MPSDPGSAGEQGDYRADQEHDKQDLGDARSAGGYTAESQHTGDDRDDEKYNCVVKHKTLDLRIADVAWLPRREVSDGCTADVDQGSHPSAVGFGLQLDLIRHREAPPGPGKRTRENRA